jgi:hypothetical protein
MIFKEFLEEYIRKKVMMTEIGMAAPMIRVLRKFFKK